MHQEQPLEDSRLAREIAQTLARDMTLHQDTLHYLQDLWGIESARDLQSFLEQESSSETQTLLELLFFPDRSCKQQLQAKIEDRQFCSKEQSRLIQNIVHMQPRARIFFPGDREPICVDLRPEIVNKFITRLQLDKNLEPEVYTIVQDNFEPTVAQSIATEIKSRPGKFAGARKSLLLQYLSKAQDTDSDFWDLLQFVLDLAQEIDPESEIWTSLVRKKIELEHSLRLAKKLQYQLHSQPMEVLLMQRTSMLCIDQVQVQQQLHHLDLLCLLLYNTTASTDLPFTEYEF